MGKRPSGKHLQLTVLDTVLRYFSMAQNNTLEVLRSEIDLQLYGLIEILTGLRIDMIFSSKSFMSLHLIQYLIGCYFLFRFICSSLFYSFSTSFGEDVANNNGNKDGTSICGYITLCLVFSIYQ